MHPQRLQLALSARLHFSFFARRVYMTLHPGQPFDENWHQDALAAVLTAVAAGDIRRLIVNQPPRSLKSIYASIAFPAWVLGHRPSAKLICASYSGEFALKLARMFRIVIDAPWYREAFPKLRWKRLTDTECTTTENGFRYTTSIGGTLTGDGGDYLIIDDPNKAEDANSEAALRAARDWYAGTLLSRVNNKVTGAIIVVMQRLHLDDLTGYLLAGGGWTHLKLGAVAQHTETFSLGNGRSHTFKAGELLQPKREPQWVLDELRFGMGAMNFSAQYLQEPQNPQGNMFKWEWLIAAVPPPLYHGVLVQSWDTAQKVGFGHDYSVCTTWLRVADGRQHYLLDVYRGRLEFPDLRRKIRELAAHHNADQVLIEEAVSGIGILQELRRESLPFRLTGIVPVREKDMRFAAATLPMEQGTVFIPEKAPWLETLRLELLAFPYGSNDDQVDSISQYLQWSAHQQPARLEQHIAIGFL